MMHTYHLYASSVFGALPKSLDYTVRATSAAHALTTFWRKYSQRKFAIMAPFDNDEFRDLFAQYATIRIVVRKD